MTPRKINFPLMVIEFSPCGHKFACAEGILNEKDKEYKIQKFFDKINRNYNGSVVPTCPHCNARIASTIQEQVDSENKLNQYASVHFISDFKLGK